MTRVISAEDFLASYAERSEVTVKAVLERRVVATCHCDYKGCEGWQVAPEDSLLPWRGEEVVIRG